MRSSVLEDAQHGTQREGGSIIFMLLEFTETILNETYNDEYYQLFIKKHPNNQEEFINEVLELFTDQNDIDDILSITIYDYGILFFKRSR